MHIVKDNKGDERQTALASRPAVAAGMDLFVWRGVGLVHVADRLEALSGWS